MQFGAAVWVVLLVVVLAAGGVVAWLVLKPQGEASSLARLKDELPGEAAGWSAVDGGTLYDRESIFDYIDGHAEVYLAYGMTGCLARRYRGPEGEADLVLDLFELSSAADAFGVFTHDRDGEPAGLGRGSLLRYGWLSFWQDRFFVSVMAEAESASSERAVLELGRAVASLLPDEGEVPALVAALPAEGLDQSSVRFLRDHQILNGHLFVAGDNLLGLGPETAAVLGRYQRQDQSVHLLLVDYPRPDDAQRASVAFRRVMLPAEATESLAESPQGGWYGVELRGARLAAALAGGSEELAAELLSEATGSGKRSAP